MKRVRLLFMGREQSVCEDVPAMHVMSVGESVARNGTVIFYTLHAP